MSVNTSSTGGSSREGVTRTGSSLLAPSKFSTNFLSGGSSIGSTTVTGTTQESKQNDSSKPSFPGFKASKLASVTQSLGVGVPPTDSKKDVPVPVASPKDEGAAAEKAKSILFLPLEKKPTLVSDALPKSNHENGDSKATVSPPKRTPPDTRDEVTTSPKRIRLETAPVVVEETAEPLKVDPIVEARPVTPQKTNKAPAAESKLGEFIFGENLTERADNFSNSKSANFIFGQNLNARAENFSPEPKEDKPDEPLPRTASQTVPAVPAVSDPKSPPKSLTESAAAYYESHATPKRKYEEVVVVTGEEGEVNVVQMSAKLHWFDKASGNWTERGRGILRLNDIAEVNAKTSAPPSSSRLVMRTSGSLRVILNTKLYRGMPVECPSEKNLRLTGMDDSGILRVFLVTGSSKDISNMHAALQFRLAAIEKAHRNDGGTVSDSESDDDEEECGKIKAPRLV